MTKKRVAKSKPKKKKAVRSPEGIEWEQVSQKRARYLHETGQSRLYTGPETSEQYVSKPKPASRKKVSKQKKKVVPKAKTRRRTKK